MARGYEKHHAGVTIKPYTVTLDGGSGFGGTLEATCLLLDGTIAEQVSIPT